MPKSGYFIIFLFIIPRSAFGQFEYLQFNHSEYRSIERLAHKTGNERPHTSVRPFRSKDFASIDSLNSVYAIKGKFENKWLWKKAFNERLVVVDVPGFSWRLDPIVDFAVGNESGSTEDKTLYTNTRGFFMEGRIGEQISFVSSFRENQALLPFWVRDFYSKNRVIPGQGISRKYSGPGRDFYTATGMLSYTPSNYFNFTFGFGNNFFGEGHRSMLLSDVAFPNTFLKIETTVWRIKYINLYNWMSDIRSDVMNVNVFAPKFNTMHYLSINLGKRWNLNFFEAIVWGDSLGNRGFDVNFLNPIIFYRPIEFAVGSSGGNALMGFGLSYLLEDKWMVYGQFALDEFNSKAITGGGGNWTNKFAWQLGTKMYDAFGVEKLFLRGEYNAARPYTFSHKDVLTNYGHYNQPLGHLWGANFHEAIVQVAYDYKRYGAEWQFIYGLQGNDDRDNYYGRGIYTSYDERPFDLGHNIAQFNRSTLLLNEFRVYYMINPAIRLRAELGYTHRQLRFNKEIIGQLENQNHSVISFAVRTQLFNRYYDF